MNSKNMQIKKVILFFLSIMLLQSTVAQQTTVSNAGVLHIPLPTLWEAVTPVGELHIYPVSKPEIDKTPPIIKFNHAKVLAVEEKIYTINGTASDKSGISAVFLYKEGNNNSIGSSENGKFSFNVELNEGINKFTVKAKDNSSNSKNEKIIITYKSTRKDYALFIVADNPSSDFQNIPTAKKDVDKLADLLESEYGFLPKILDNPTVAEFRTELKRYYEKQYNENDQLFVYFVGHGDIDVGFDGEPSEYYFVLKGENGRLTQKSFKKQLNSLPVKQILFVANACYSGAEVYQSQFIPDYTPSLTTDEQINKFLYTKKCRKIIAAGKGQIPSGFESSRIVTEMIKYLNNKNEILTVQDFGKSVTNFTYKKVKDKPVFGRFDDDNPSSSFVFVPKSLSK